MNERDAFEAWAGPITALAKENGKYVEVMTSLAWEAWQARSVAGTEKTMTEPFSVKHYIAEDRPILKGNGFDGLELGEDRDEAEQFTEWVNNRLRESERLKQTLKDAGLLLHHFWCDVSMNDYSFAKLNEGIAAIDAALTPTPESKP